MHYGKRRLGTALGSVALGLLCAGPPAAHGWRVDEGSAAVAASNWVARSSLFRQVAARHEPPAEFRPADATLTRLDADGLPFHCIRLLPRGYVLLNSDRRLPPVLAFSASGRADFRPVRGNAFRALLTRDMRRLAAVTARLDGVTAAAAPEPGVAACLRAWDQLLHPLRDGTAAALPGETLVSPMLATAWDQCRHYNFYAPADPVYDDPCYDDKVPSGCVPVVGGQIMKYYAWPPYGYGAARCTDAAGAVQGTHAVDLSDPYNWSDMKNAYNPYAAEPTSAVHAVAELLYELGVAVNIDFDPDGSSSDIRDLNRAMGSSLFYEPGTAHAVDGTNPVAVAAFATLLRAEMLARRPAVVSVPGHAVVADGLGVDGGADYYHINYGWGGLSNDWYRLESVGGSPLDGGIIGLRPSLTPLPDWPLSWTNPSGTVTLRWSVPAARTNALQQQRVLRRQSSAGPFSDPCGDLTSFRITSESDFVDWTVATGGRTGMRFHKAAGGYDGLNYSLTSRDPFVPAAATRWSLYYKAKLANDAFQMQVSTNAETAYTNVFSVTNVTAAAWTSVSNSLAAWSGRPVYLRLNYRCDRFFADGFVSVDDILVTGAQWFAWPAVVTTTRTARACVASGYSDGVHRFALQGYDGTNWSERSPPVTVTVGDGDGMPWEWEIANGLDPVRHDAGGNPDGDTLTNYAEYVANTCPTSRESVFAVTNLQQAAGGGVAVHFLAHSGRTYTVEYRDAMTGRVWRLLQSAVVGTGQRATVTDPSGRPMRFYRLRVRLSP